MKNIKNMKIKLNSECAFKAHEKENISINAAIILTENTQTNDDLLFFQVAAADGLVQPTPHHRPPACQSMI